MSSHISPRNRLGKPTRISLWKVGWRISVAPRPFSMQCQLCAQKLFMQAYLGDTPATSVSWLRPLVSAHFQGT